MSLSRRRSLRRGTAGHDGFPRALGIMPRHFLRRGIRTHNEIPRTLGIMRPHHHTNRLGSPLGKSLDSSESRLFCLYLSFSRRNKKRKATCVSKSHNHGGFSKHMWLLGGIGVRYRGSRTYCADASAEAVVASAEPVAVASAEALGLSDGTGEADAVPGARRTIRHVPSW